MFQANSNLPENEIELAILDRFFLARFYEVTRDDKVLLDVMGVQWSLLAEDMKSHFQTDFRRLQYLIAKVTGGFARGAPPPTWYPRQALPRLVY